MNAAPKAFFARISALSEVLAHIDKICLRAGLSNDKSARVALVIEELFSNTVAHGYQQDSEHSVWISAEGDSRELRLVYQDEAPAFNPLKRPTETLPATLGGWGIQLIEHFADADYHYDNGRNTLTLNFKINEPAE
jgi:anti-sigma regulatory factor (Ser/Thr protein kinase)